MPNIDFSQNTPMESSGMFRDDTDPKVTKGHWILATLLIVGGLTAALVRFI